MPRGSLEVADVFRAHGPAWRRARAGHLSLGQLKVMSAIEHCRTAALGGHVAACEKCGHTHIAYNSCRNRHCPKCQGAAAKDWLAARQAELLPVEYYHVVFTLPAPIADIAYHNKAVIYGILFKAAAETLITIARDPKHLGARIGLIGVLHTWGSALYPSQRRLATFGKIVAGAGGLSPDGGRWISCRPGFFLPVRVLSRLFRRLFLDKLAAAHDAGRLRFFGNYRHLADAPAFAGYDPVPYARSNGWSTPSAPSPTTTAMHRLVNSSITVSMPNFLPSCVRSIDDSRIGPDVIGPARPQTDGRIRRWPPACPVSVASVGPSAPPAARCAGPAWRSRANLRS